MKRKYLSPEEDQYLCEFFETCNDLKARRVRIEIMRLLQSLDFTILMEYEIYYYFQKIYRTIPCYTRLRDFERLIPVLLYLFLKYQNYNVDKRYIVKNSVLSKREFDGIKFELGAYKIFLIN